MNFKMTEALRYELSLAQHEVYFDQIKSPDSPLYNVGGFISFEAVSTTRLATAHKLMVEREEIFGLRVSAEGANITQHFALPSERNSEIEIVDFSDSESCDAADNWTRKIFSEPFEMHESQLFKAFILILPAGKVRYLVLAHHLMMDGWGFANWSARINDYYNDIDHQAQHSGWWIKVLEDDKKYRTGKRLESDKTYWSNHQALKNRSFMQEFYPVAEKGISKSIRLSESLPSTLIEQINALAKSNDIQPGQFYLGSLATYLGKVYEQTHFNIGLPLHNRRSHAHKQMLGMFTNISPLAIEFDVSYKFSELIQHINTSQMSDWRHQRLPISHMDRKTESGRLFDISYSYLNLEGNLNFEGQPAAINYVAHNHETNPAMLTVWNDGNADETVLHLDINLAFFSAKEGAEFLSRYVELLSQLSSEPNTDLNDITVISEKEIASLQANFEPSIPSRYKTVIDYFVAQARKVPNDVALCWNDEKWTYEKLEKRSSEIANFLSSRGVNQQDYVGVFMDRTPQLIASLLAIWRLGAIYVPLDTNYPADRINLIVEDCDICLTLVDSNKAFPIKEEGASVQLNDVVGSTLFVPRMLDADNISHLIYTSGSTGQPKGVMVCHRNVTSLVEWANKYFSSDELSNTLASTSMNFDLSVFEFFVPLSLGHTVTLVDSALTLLDFNKTLPITLINTVPSAIEALLKNNAIPSLTMTFNIAGEPLSKALVNKIFEQFPTAVVNNLYGPSEDTTYSTVQQFNKPLRHKPSIGRCIAGTKSYVVSSEGKLLPQGTPGELYLVGDGIVQGYLNRPELTAEKFVKPDFLDGEIAYKTGDIVRLRDNGELEYLGRQDEQVKFSGHRVELGEVDSNLTQMPIVSEAKTIVCEDGDTPKLVSFVTLKAQQENSTKDVLSRLQQVLPSYMVPSELYVIENIPLLPNGKVDKRQLAEKRNTVNTRNILFCEGATELKLAKIWQRVLNCEMDKIGANVSFFELGGRSLQYASLLADVNETFLVQLSFTELFASQNLRHLANIIDSKEQVEDRDIVPLDHDESVRVSKAQEQIWLQQKIHGDSYQYNMPVALSTKENVDVGRINKTIGTLLTRHSILRSIHVEEQGVVKQVVLSEVSANIAVYDFTKYTGADVEFNQQLSLDISKPFSLESDILMRASLYRLSEKQHVLVFVFHHLVVDGIAIQLLINEFNRSYNESTLIQSSNTQCPSIQFRDFCAWQRAQPENDFYQSGIEYFKQLLDKAPISHSLPVDGIKGHHNESGRIVSHLTNYEIQNIEQLSNELSVSEFDVVHTLLALLYTKISQVDDIVIGTPVANRLTPASQQMIGCFVNMLPLRTEVDATSTFAELVQNVSDRTRRALDYQSVYFSDLVELLPGNQAEGLSPIFQLMISFDEYEQEEFNENADATEWKHFDLDWATALFDIELRVLKLSGDWRLEWVFDCRKFSSEFIIGLQKKLTTLISQVVDKMNLPVADFSLIDEDSFKQVKHKLANSTKSEVISLTCSIDDAFQRHSDQLAVHTTEGSLTYEQLGLASQKLISGMLAKGVEAGDRVGILLNRDIWLIPAVLATLKTGVTFVPLDPSYPKSRLQFMMADSEVTCVITDLKLSEQFQLGNLALITESLEQEEGALFPLFKAPEPDLTAYIIYTSGSTGRPKGVSVSNSAISAHIASIGSKLDLTPNDNILQIASFSFDTFLEHTLAGLCSGASLFLTEQTKLDSVEFFELLAAKKITTVDLPVAYLALWLEQEYAERWMQSNLRQVYVGGEALPPKVVKNWFKYGKNQNCNLFNAYGPTEAVITSTVREITLNDTHKVPIGEVIGRRSLLVLNEHQDWCEPGIVGELYIGGEAIADGYINQPELTKSHFISIKGETDQTYYRTGDKVWYDINGVVYFVGRVDEQIQLHGVRIELAEVESALSGYSGIQSLKVCLKREVSSSLIAYIIKNAEEDFDEKLFLQFAKTVLPAHCVPRHCVLLDNWPLTGNGKICVKSLPSPQLYKSTVAKCPETKLEKQLQSMWAELLGCENSKIGITDNFFEVGGNSLSLLKLSAKVHDLWGVKLDVSKLFSAPTIAALANEIDNNNFKNKTSVEIKCSMAEQIPVSSQQNRIWLQHQLAGDQSHAFNMIKAISVKGLADVNVIRAALKILWQRHSVLRSKFNNDAGEVLVSQHEINSIPVELLEVSSSEELDSILNELAKHNFDLANEPLIYCKLCQIGDMDWAVVINMHHIVSDGWSIQIFEREFIELCCAIIESKKVELPPLPIQYSDYAVFQSQSSVVNEAQLEFWKKYLADAPACHDILLDFERGLQQSGKGRNIKHQLCRTLSHNIDKFCIDKAVTPFILLQSAFSLFVAKESGTKDVVIGTPVANRAYTQTENLMGCFMNMIALRTNVKFEDSFTSILQRQKSMIYQAFEHQAVPFETVVEALNPTRITQFSPLFQIAFIYHEQPEVSVKIPGVVIDEIEIEECGAKYDITLNVELIAGRFYCNWEYDTAIFSKQRVEQFAANFETFVGNLLSQPEQPIKAIPLLAKAEHEAILKSGLGADLVLPEVVGVDQLIDNMAEHSRRDIAIVEPSRNLTYEQVNKQSNQFAHAILDLGIKPGQKVGVRMEPSADLIIAILGIMKARAIYVPLAVDSAVGRLNKIINHAELKFIISEQEGTKCSVPEHSVADLNLSKFPASNINPGSRDLADCAYILYTSGSTGMPKGVQISHGAFLNFICSMAKKPGMDSNDRLLTMTSPTFDISGLELFLPLVVGAQLVCDNADIKMDGKALGDLLKRHEITVFQTTPVVWRLLIESGWTGSEKLKALCGGEALPKDLANKLSNKVAQLWNMYGPTETTVWSSCSMISPKRDNEIEVDIGNSIHNTQIFVLDSELNPVPNGSKGQIFIAGKGLAIGYLNLPAENRTAFVSAEYLPSSFKNLGVDRLYATGDLGRFDLNGKLQHLGRKDHQIKLRGFRIEPGEIESTIDEMELVEDSLVVVNDEKLVAYCVADKKSISVSDIRSKLIEALPQYMVPQFIVILSAFPVTPSGKKDRKRLPPPVDINQEGKSQTNQIENQTQKQISVQLSEIISVADLDINISFFDLGANSMDIVNLAGNLSSVRNQDISPIDLFQYPSISSLAEFLDSKGEALQTDSRKQNLSEAKQRLKKRRKRKSNHDKANIS